MEFSHGEFLGRPALVDESGLKYSLLEDGLIRFGDVALSLLGRQCQYASRYIDPAFSEATDPNLRSPNLGVGLRVKTEGVGGNYHEFGIHPDDVDEFVDRFAAYEMLRSGLVKEDEETRQITPVERQALEAYFAERGVTVATS